MLLFIQELIEELESDCGFTVSPNLH